MGDDPDERPDEQDTIGPPDEGGPVSQELRYEEAENLDPDTSLADPAVSQAGAQ